MGIDLIKMRRNEHKLIDYADAERGKWIVSISEGDIKSVGKNFDYDVVPDYFNDWRDGRTFDNYNHEVGVHVLLYNLLFKCEEGEAEKKDIIKTLRELNERKAELEEDLEITNKELEKINGYIAQLEEIRKATAL